MKNCITLFFTFVAGAGLAQKTSHEVTINPYRCVYNTTDGRIDGHYVSYYANGQKRAEGSFKNHHRDSIWTVWDTAGNVTGKRHYKNGMVYLTENKNTATLDGAGVNPKKYSCRLYPYTSFNESDVSWTKRIWRYIPNEQYNRFLFGSNNLNQNMLSAAVKGTLPVYSGSNDQFAVPFEGWTTDTSAKIIGYRIKEDWYFDKSRSVMDVRIVGLAPVVIKPGTSDTTNLYWVYFTDLRPLLLNTPLIRCYMATNMDEFFGKRAFTSTIYKESNVYDRSLADYLPLKARDAEAERIELDMIETEHDLWMK